MLKCRLYDIDWVISRTLAYAIITGLLAGVYAGLVLLVTGVFGVRAPVAVAAAMLAAAALFSPVRKRVQHRVDRRFNRAWYDAEATVAAFGAWLKDAVEVDAVRDLASVVQAALESAHLWLWTSEPDWSSRCRRWSSPRLAASRAGPATGRSPERPLIPTDRLSRSSSRPRHARRQSRPSPPKGLP